MSFHTPSHSQHPNEEQNLSALQKSPLDPVSVTVSQKRDHKLVLSVVVHYVNCCFCHSAHRHAQALSHPERSICFTEGPGMMQQVASSPPERTLRGECLPVVTWSPRSDSIMRSYGKKVVHGSRLAHC